MALSQIEKEVVNRVINKIIDDCVTKHPEEKISCIGDRSIGITYINDVIQDLPRGHPLKDQGSKISEIVNDIKEDTVKWAVLMGIM